MGLFKKDKPENLRKEYEAKTAQKTTTPRTISPQSIKMPDSTTQKKDAAVPVFREKDTTAELRKKIDDLVSELEQKSSVENRNLVMIMCMASSLLNYGDNDRTAGMLLKETQRYAKSVLGEEAVSTVTPAVVKTEQVTETKQASEPSLKQTKQVQVSAVDPFDAIRKQLEPWRGSEARVGIFANSALDWIQALVERNEKEPEALEALVEELGNMFAVKRIDIDKARYGAVYAAECAMYNLHDEDAVNKNIAKALRGINFAVALVDAKYEGDRKEARAANIGKAMAYLAAALWVAKDHELIGGECEYKKNPAEEVTREVLIPNFDQFINKNFDKAVENKQKREEEYGKKHKLLDDDDKAL